MIANNQTNEYPDLEEYLTLFSDTEDFELIFQPHGLMIRLKLVNIQLRLHNSDLKRLIDGKKVKGGVTYHGSSGFTYKNYSEICIALDHPDYMFLDIPDQWRTKPLKFNIGNTSYEISLASPLFVLLFEPIYRDSDFQYGFQSYASVKIFCHNKNLVRANLQKALYYLNSSILKRIGFIASVHHLEIPYSDPLDLWSNDIDDIFDTLKSHNLTNKIDLVSIEPLAFYNAAITSKGDDKFLHLYRIFKFFMNRSRLEKLKKVRNNPNYSEEDILKFIDNRNEESLLTNLINESLVGRNQVKQKILNLAVMNKLIQNYEIKNLVKSLYKFRNSIVHAKEKEINNTIIPDPFVKSTKRDLWIEIISNISIETIRKYNRLHN